MSQRVPASMNTRQSLSELIDGRFSTADGRSELVKLATRLIIEEALEAESWDALGRDYYEHGASRVEEGRGGGRLAKSRSVGDLPPRTGHSA